MSTYFKGVVYISVNGNLDSLKESVIDELEALSDIKPWGRDFVTEEVVQKLAELTALINREIAIYINRKGNIIDVSVGDSSTVNLGEVEGRRSKARLSGIRCIHTHPNGSSMLSEVDLNSLMKLNLDAIAAVGVQNGVVNGISVAVPGASSGGRREGFEILGPFRGAGQKLDSLMELILERDTTNGTMEETGAGEAEKAILVGTETPGGKLINDKTDGERSLEELEELSLTAGLAVINKVIQKRASRDAAYYIGRGKVDELGLMCQAMDADVLIFDDELTGAQIRNIENATGAKVIDRTTLILDIFAQRAHSSEGKLQVELAQLKYRLPRLTGLGGQLSRLGGGIGTRGPGEKKLEVDRRHIRRRVSFLEGQLKKLEARRGMMRENRKQKDIPVIALVGYTNAGKSSIMNRLCNVEQFAEDKLFATLDPAARQFVLPDGRDAMLIDTVGFIRKLPHDLVEAFKSTLEEAVYADLLLLVVDVSDEEAEEHIPVVEDILKGLGILNKPSILILNKIDRLRDSLAVRLLSSKSPTGAFEVSAKTGEGIGALLRGISDVLPVNEVEMEILVPFNEGALVSGLHNTAQVLEKEYSGDGVRLKVRVKTAYADKLREYSIVKEESEKT